MVYMKQAIIRSYKYIECMSNIYCVYSNVVSASSKQFIEYILNSNIYGFQWPCSFSVLAAVMQYNCLCFCRCSGGTGAVAMGVMPSPLLTNSPMLPAISAS